MSTPTKPSDHKPKKTKKSKVEILDGGVRRVTLYGDFLVDVDPAALDDFELLDRLGTLEQNPAEVPAVIRQAVGDGQYQAVMDRLRDPATKRVSIAAGVGFFRDLFGALNPNG